MLRAEAPDGVPEVRDGADLTTLLLAVADPTDGDIVAVTSKVVSKAEGRTVEGERADWVGAETVRDVASRGETRIVRNRLGLTLAAAGVDGSNVAAGTSLLLPLDPDGTARTMRTAIAGRTGANVGVIVTDTAGRPWRAGQTDIAIGAAGIRVLEDFAGQVDAHGNELAVTAPAVADELAATAELASRKLGGRPFVVIGGRSDLVLPAGHDGAGAAALIRPEGEDLFGYGAREAVIRAARADELDSAPFGTPVSAPELVTALLRAGFPDATAAEARVLASAVGDRAGMLTAVAFAHGWRVEDGAEDARRRLRPVTP